MKTMNDIKHISDIPYYLNLQLTDDNPIDIFSYQVSGYYEVIKFGDYVLWDTETHDFNYQNYEDEDYLVMLTKYVKEEFNKYLSKLTKYRFLDVKVDEKILSDSFDAGDGISQVLSLEGITLTEEMFQKIVNIVEKYS